MKTKTIRILLAVCLVLLMMIPVLTVPTYGAVQIYKEHTFDDLTLGAQGVAGLSTYFTGNTVPSSATVVKDPAPSHEGDQVIQMSMAPAKTGSAGYDFIIWSGKIQPITWTGTTSDATHSKIYTGTFSDASGTVYEVKSYDEKKTIVNAEKNLKKPVYNDAAMVEACNGGNNIDRNLTVTHSAYKYNTHKQVVMQAEYYIPTGTKGCFENQQISFTYYLKDSTDATQKTSSFLNFYRIDAGEGTLMPAIFGSDVAETVSIEKDTWFTVSLAIDLQNGTADLYINNLLVQSGQMLYNGAPIKNIVLTANKWNIAKVNRNGGFAGGLYGNFYVDNAIIHKYDASQKVVFGNSTNDAGEPAIAVSLKLPSGRECGASLTDTVLVGANMTAEPVYLTDSLFEGLIAPLNGASIRLTGMGGMRFGTKVNSAKMEVLQAMKEAGQIKDLQIGTLITPASYVVEAGGFTKEALSKLSYSAKYLDVKASVGAYYPSRGVALGEGYDKLFVGSIINIKAQNFTRAFAGIGYVKVTLLDGTEKYYYSYDYTNSGVLDTNHSRSISSVASVFVNDPAYGEYKALLQGFIRGLTVIDDSTLLKKVQYTASGFFFQNSAGVSMRLTYDGVSGWRFQAVKPTSSSSPYNNFDNIGAGQSLALYMGESYGDDTQALSVGDYSASIKIVENSTGSYVIINKTGSFDIKFYSPSGVLMNNITSVTASGTNVTLKGSLLSSEAIYGGGQRFESANKRGKSLSLFTYDAYNTDSGKGTYTAIPLFVSSRGSGMFINRYEIMTADFGKASSNQWSISIDNDLMDCYFYSTGKMSDVYAGYINISGQPAMPEEWAQGTIVCRYSPDMTSLDGTPVKYSKLTDIPGYTDLYLDSAAKTAATSASSFTNGQYFYSSTGARSFVYQNGIFYRVTPKGNPAGYGVRQIVENLINAGMKPDCVLAEPINWANTSRDNTGAKDAFQQLKDVADWLEEKDIKFMVYMAVGQISTTMAGWKDEYFVRADVTINVTQASTTNRPHSYVSSTKTNTSEIPRTGQSDNPDAINASAYFRYLDITNPEAVEWYMNTIWGTLIDIGVDGCKVDFCEVMPNRYMDLTAYNSSTKSYEKIGTATVDYHWYDESIFEDDTVHHAYASYFQTIFYQSMMEQKAAKNIPDGFNLLSRGGGIGVQRNPSMWAGDQTRTEGNMKSQLVTLLNSGISGVPFMSYDMAGYAYNSTGGYFSTLSSAEAMIYLRSLQFTAFTTMIQTHGDVRMVYDMAISGKPAGYVSAVSAQYIELRKLLMPYITKWSEVSCETGMPLVRHLVLHYQNDSNVWNIDDQFMLGDGLMVAPILSTSATSRSVYVPAGNWVNLLTGEIMNVGSGGKTITVNADINQVPLFLNLDSEDAQELEAVFNSAIWQNINNGKFIFGAGSDTDPYDKDIF